MRAGGITSSVEKENRLFKIAWSRKLVMELFIICTEREKISVEWQYGAKTNTDGHYTTFKGRWNYVFEVTVSK